VLWNALVDHSLAAELVAHDLRRQEKTVSVGVIAMVMGVDQPAERLAGGPLGTGDEGLA